MTERLVSNQSAAQVAARALKPNLAAELSHICTARFSHVLGSRSRYAVEAKSPQAAARLLKLEYVTRFWQSEFDAALGDRGRRRSYWLYQPTELGRAINEFL